MRSLLGRQLLPTVGLVSLLLTLGAVTVPAEAQPTTPSVDAAPQSATETDETAETAETTDADLAEAALAQVQGYLGPERRDAEDAPTARAAEAVAAADLTMALRELRLRMADLSASDRAAARRIIARPSADRFRDFGSVRVHWSSTDSAAVGRPAAWDAWVNQVGAVVTHVLTTYQGAGYRAPDSDGALGGGVGKLDIYLVDFAAHGDPGIYGYCNSDKAMPAKGPNNAWAFCAFDHDFTSFPNRTPLENLKVTAAHELFHATQFAYDYREDAWFMEATAVWAEDEVYDAINDNLQYNNASPLRDPRQSLDQFGTGMRQYGAWFFFRYLSERFPAAQGGLPIIIRRIWERADASAGAPDRYSMQAIRRELAARHTDLRRIFTRFADGNRRPKRTYAEGARYPKAPAIRLSVTRAHPGTGWQRFRLDHLAAATYVIKPRKKMRNWRLRVAVNLPPKRIGSAAMLTAYGRHGRIRHKMVKLSKAGKGSAKVRFDSRRTRRVELTLVNASTRYRCGVGWVNDVRYSCDGRPRDDHKAMKFRFRAVR